ncbi:MAG TPA: ABC transporter permease [Acidimicrobiales bacterium]
MRLAWRELFRRPKNFAVPLGTLVLLALLLLYPSAILDGVVGDATAAMRNADADLVVYARDANGVILRSRIEPSIRAGVAQVDGVAEVATFDVALFTGKVTDREEPVGFAVLTSDDEIGSRLPDPGEAYADESLKERAGLAEGSEIVLGPFRVPVRVVGFTKGTNLLFSGGLVVDKSTWLAAYGQPEVDENTVQSAASQALLITLEPGADSDDVAAAIDEATGGETQTMTRSAAIQAMPGVKQQASTFGYIRIVTLMVALVVVGLFLSFVTLERAPLYAVMKALGASSGQIFFGMVAQVLFITDLALYAAALLTWGLTNLPIELPTEMRMARFIETAVALRVAAVVGSALSLRRVVRVDPADAIG